MELPPNLIREFISWPTKALQNRLAQKLFTLRPAAVISFCKFCEVSSAF